MTKTLREFLLDKGIRGQSFEKSYRLYFVVNNITYREESPNPPYLDVTLKRKEDNSIVVRGNMDFLPFLDSKEYDPRKSLILG